MVSAPSGTGKTTLVDRLVTCCPDLRQSRSYTSREARVGEQDGVDYNFISRERFEAMIEADDFLEWANIFGNLYGTSRVATEDLLAAGIDLVLVIDVQGARQVRRRMPEAVGIFVLPPSFDVLASRLRRRNKDSEASISRRLDTARAEVDAVEDYDYVVVNDEVDHAVAELDAIIRAERARLRRRRGVVAPILETFTPKAQ